MKETPIKSSSQALTPHESVALLGMIVLADITIYRGQGFAGLGALAIIAPLLIWLGSQRRQCAKAALLIGAMLVALGLRMFVCGNFFQVIIAGGLLASFAAACAGIYPHLIESAVFGAQTIQSGYAEINVQFQRFRTLQMTGYRVSWLSAVLPAGALMLFGLLFTLANPDLLSALNSNLQWFVGQIRTFLSNLPGPIEILLWCAVGWIGLGALRPLMENVDLEEAEWDVGDAAESQLFAPFRNTLWAVIGLFALYLIFEFKTLWVREFPEGFYYAGYAHEGAAWLTVALGLATLMLSAVFRGSMLADPRCPQLRKLAWIWSGENFLLAIAVFNRLNIYVDFNGMTRMRVIGYFGISAVVGGLAVVLWKIAFQKNFRWLIRRQLWVLGLTLYLHAITPVDAWVMKHNVRRITAGDLSPSVQISVHPINDEGYLKLPPLLSSSDDKIREGIRAMLHDRWLAIESEGEQSPRRGWTAFQRSRARLVARLNALQPEFTQTLSERQSAFEEFKRYAYQWY